MRYLQILIYELIIVSFCFAVNDTVRIDIDANSEEGIINPLLFGSSEGTLRPHYTCDTCPPHPLTDGMDGKWDYENDRPDTLFLKLYKEGGFDNIMNIETGCWGVRKEMFFVFLSKGKVWWMLI